MSKGKVAFREVSPILQHIREFLLGRPHVQALRFEPDVAPRTQPPPQIPDGVAHKHADNYYYTRDARKAVTPPLNVSQTLLAASSDEGEAKAARNAIPTPGKLFNWDRHDYVDPK